MTLITRHEIEKSLKELYSSTNFTALVWFIKDWKQKALENNLNVASTIWDLIKDSRKQGIELDVAPLYEQPETIFTQEYQSKLSKAKLAFLPVIKQYYGIEDIL